MRWMGGGVFASSFCFLSYSLALLVAAVVEYHHITMAKLLVRMRTGPMGASYLWGAICVKIMFLAVFIFLQRTQQKRSDMHVQTKDRLRNIQIDYVYMYT